MWADIERLLLGVGQEGRKRCKRSRPSHICSFEDLPAIVANQQIGDRGLKSLKSAVLALIPKIRATEKPAGGQVDPPAVLGTRLFWSDYKKADRGF
jgi:hypothetical protein